MKKNRILVVEDDALLQMLYQRVLMGMGLQVVIARNAHEALTYLQQTPPDLMTLDVNLPDANGLDFLYELRQNPKLAGLKVIIITANVTAIYHRHLCLADALLEKPLQNQELVEACLHLLGCPTPV